MISGNRSLWRPCDKVIRNFLPLYHFITLPRFLLLMALPLYHLSLTTDVYAAFKDSGFGARPVGMGGAFTAIADDSNAPLWNPAGIAQLETREFAVMYGRPYLGLDLNSGENDTTFLQIGNISAATPIQGFGAMGFSWTNFLVSKLYQENSFVFNYANSLHDKLFSSGNTELYAGFNLKVLRRSFSVDTDTIEREKDSAGNLVASSPFNEPDAKSALSFDFGVLSKFADTIAVGFAAKNLDNPDVGFKTEDRLPREFQGGVAFFAKDIGPFEDLTPAFEVSYRKAGDQKADIRPHVGAETWLGLHTYGLRMGGNDRELTFGLSYAKTFPKFVFQIDYSFVGSLTLRADNVGTHRVAIVWKQFTPAISKKKIEWKQKKAESSELRVESKEMKQPEAPVAENLPVQPSPTDLAPEPELLEEPSVSTAAAPTSASETVPEIPPTPQPTLRQKTQIEVNFLKGERFFNLRNYDTAKKAFENVLQIDPNHKASLNYLRKIAAIEKQKLIKPVPINKASIRDFLKVGFSEADARRIMVQRIKKPFTEVEEIGMIQGLDVKTYQKVKGKLTLK